MAPTTMETRGRETGTDIALGPGERGILVGKTRTGKSTLGTYLVRTFLKRNPRGQALIIDSKPRFRASWKPSGVKMNYKGWVDGDELDGSVGVGNEIVPLKQAFQHSRVVILQSRDERRNAVPDFRYRVADYCDQLFKLAGKSKPCLLFIDEFYDLCGPSGQVHPNVLATIREGGEVNIAVLAGSQRPRAIPVPILSEADRYYVFYLRFAEDIKRMTDFGLYPQRPTGHQFLYFRNHNGTEVETLIGQLKLGKKGG